MDESQSLGRNGTIESQKLEDAGSDKKYSLVVLGACFVLRYFMYYLN
jgi:hypothetical protein